MHILIVAPEEIPVPPVKGGSVEICIEQMAKRMAANHRVTVISRQHEEYPNTQKQGNLTYIRVPVRPEDQPEHYIRAVIKKLKGKKFDWIQIDNRPKFIPFIRAAFPRTPISIFLHSLTFIDSKRIQHRDALACLSRTNLIICNSESTRHILKQQFPKLAPKMRRVWLGVDSTVFRPPTRQQQQDARSKYKVSSGYVVLFAGRIIPRKGLDVLIKALHLVRRNKPALQLVVAGSGKKGYVSQIERLARRLKVPAKFLGKIPHRDIHEVFWLADCFVCPSQQHESFGLVNVEAMASGLPLIASRNGGIQEIVQNRRNGLLVQQFRDPRKWARHIQRTMENQRLNERLKLQARKDTLRKFSWESTVSRLLKIYQSDR